MNKDSTIRIMTLADGATAPAGFLAGGVACGVRGSGTRDLGLLFSARSCDAAAVFTRNEFQGAPLAVTREAVSEGGLRGVVANRGTATAGAGGAAVVPRNESQGAPLAVTREAVSEGGLRGVVANSGNANAATGARGVG